MNEFLRFVGTIALWAVGGYVLGEVLEYYANKIGKGYAEGKATVPVVITQNWYNK